MNKELLNENLNIILEGLKTVIHTANAELPAILEEIVRWGIIKYSVLTIIFFMCLLLFVWTTRFFIKNDEEHGLIGFTILLSLITLIPFIYNLIKLLFVTISPKLYIIHYLKDLFQ